MCYVIQKLSRSVKRTVFNFLCDQAISLRIINEKHGYAASELHSKRVVSKFLICHFP